MDLKDIKLKRLSDMEKKIFFLAWLNERLKAAGSRALPVLVGGSAVQLYTAGNYASFDMDIILDDLSKVVGILEKNGFVKTGRHYYSKEYNLLAEFVSGSIPEKVTEIAYEKETVLISSLEEMIIDRLTAAKWWKIPKDLEWARVMIASENSAELDMDYLRKRSKEEDIEDFLERAFEENKKITDNDIESR